MISRFISFIIVLLYLFSSLKMTFDVHFCGEQVKYVSFSGINQKTCCGEDEDMEGGCCHNQKLSFKVNDHASIDAVSAIINLHPVINDYKPVQFIYTNYFTCFHKDEQAIIEDPPPKVKTPIFIRNRVLRI